MLTPIGNNRSSDEQSSEATMPHMNPVDGPRGADEPGLADIWAPAEHGRLPGLQTDALATRRDRPWQHHPADNAAQYVRCYYPNAISASWMKPR